MSLHKLNTFKDHYLFSLNRKTGVRNQI